MSKNNDVAEQDVPEQEAQEAQQEANEAEDTTEIRAAFDAAVEAGKDEDTIKMDMIGAGAKFKNVTRLFNSFMVDAGIVKSKEEKDEILQAALEGKDLTDEDTFNAAVEELQEKLEVNERSAAGSLRQWAKKAEVDFYKKPAGGGTGRSGITSKILDYIVENPKATEEQLVAHLEEIGTANTLKHKTLYVSILEAAGKIAAKYDEAA